MYLFLSTTKTSRLLTISPGKQMPSWSRVATVIVGSVLVEEGAAVELLEILFVVAADIVPATGYHLYC